MKQKNILSISAVVVLAGIILGFAFANRKTDVASAAAAVTASITPPTTNSVATSTSSGADEYKDGTYTATGSYESPAGKESVAVSLTISNDIVTDATVTSLAQDNTSKHYQGLFIGGYKQYVIGKSVDSIHLDAVSGSSLTPIGFNDALAQIKTEAGA